MKRDEKGLLDYSSAVVVSLEECNRCIDMLIEELKLNSHQAVTTYGHGEHVAGSLRVPRAWITVFRIKGEYCNGMRKPDSFSVSDCKMLRYGVIK